MSSQCRNSFFRLWFKNLKKYTKQFFVKILLYNFNCVPCKAEKREEKYNNSYFLDFFQFKTDQKNCWFVYVGYVGGFEYHHSGAAVEPVCLPRNPEWGKYRDWRDGNKAYIYGAEYETSDLSGKWYKLHDHDVPCAVCLVRNKSVVKMFAGRNYQRRLLQYFDDLV